MSMADDRGLSSQGQKKLRKQMQYYLQKAKENTRSKKAVLMFFAQKAISDQNGNQVVIGCFVSKTVCFL